MRFKRIDILNVILLGIIGIFIYLISFPEYKYLTGWLVGGLAGMVYFWLIRYSLARPLVIKSKRYTRCKIARFAMMGVLVALAAIFPQHLNVICLLIGFMVNKLSIIIMEGIVPGKGSVRKDVNAK